MLDRSDAWLSRLEQVSLALLVILLSLNVFLGTLARWHPHKDHATLVEAIALLSSRIPDLHLLIAGEGELRFLAGEQTLVSLPGRGIPGPQLLLDLAGKVDTAFLRLKSGL